MPVGVLDPWSYFEHKDILDRTQGEGANDGLAPTWAGKEHRRRLNAYWLCGSLLRNVNRFNLARVTPEEKRDRREYGDAKAFVDAVRAAVIGETFSWAVDNAGGDEPQPPAELPEDADEAQAAAFDRAMAEYRDAAAARDLSLRRQAWVDDLSDKLRMTHKVIYQETNAVGLGDAVWVIGTDWERGRPTLELWDPDSYFPVLDHRRPNDYPRKVHLAYEYDERRPGDDDVSDKFVRRVTYELIRLTDLQFRLPPAIGDFELPVPAGARRTPQGRLVREYEPGVESEWTCLVTDATWAIGDLGDRANHVEDLSEARAKFAFTEEDEPRIVKDLDLFQDWLPIVHEPNTVAELEHFGTSSLALVAQIFDDLQLALTDLQEGATMVGGPILAVRGNPPVMAPRDETRGRVSPAQQVGTVETYGPRQAWFLGDSGGVDVVDLSGALDALVTYVEFLHDYLSQTGRMPKEALGRVDSSQVPSGFAMLLGYTPLRNLVGEMRLTRDDKYPILWSFLQRRAMALRADFPDSPWTLEPGEVLRVEMAYGQFLPSDLQGLITLLAAAVEANILSRETAVAWLKLAGAPIESLDEELRQIRQRDFTGGQALADATGSEKAAAQYLDIAEELLPDPAEATSVSGGRLGAVENPDEAE